MLSYLFYYLERVISSMSEKLIIALILFSLLLLVIVLKLIADRKLPVRYSLIWIFSSILIFFVGVFPNLIEFVTSAFGFVAISNFVIGILLTMLLSITLILAVIVSGQKKQIKRITQELSILRSYYNGDNNEKK